jgi:hypothetical protein
MRRILLTALLAAAPVSALAQVNVRALSVVPNATGVAGQQLQIVASFQSDGDQPMPAFRWRALLTVGGVLDGAIPFGTFGPITVSGAQPQVFTVNPTLPANASGHFTVAIVADHDDAVVESNEYDNAVIASAVTHVVARAADLEVTSAAASQRELRAGEPVDVSFTIANGGQLGASINVGAYLSEDAVVTPSDRLLGSTNVTVGAGGSVSGAIAGVVPSDAPVGDHTIGVIADPDGSVVEPDEANNIRDAAPLNIFEDSLALDTETLPGATLTIPYHVVLAASGGDGHYAWTVLSGALPNGVSLAEDGTLEGTPTRTGSYDFEIGVESRGMTDRRAYSVEVVSTFQPLRIVTQQIQTGFHRYPYQQILVAGGGEPPYQWRLDDGDDAIAPGLDLSTSGVISGIPNQLGTFTFAVTVEDRLGAIDSVQYEVEVTPLATVLILNTQDPVALVGQPFDYALQAMGGIQPYRWEAASTPPPGLSVTEDGRISGTPSRVGQWPVRVRVIDSTNTANSDTALFQVEVQDDGAMNVLTTSLPAGLVRSKFEVPIEVEGGAPPYRFSLGPGESLPEGFFLSDEGAVVGRAFRPLVHGFSVIVEDSHGRAAHLPYAIVIEAGSGSFNAGCVCIQPRGGAGFLLLGLLWFFRRRRG